MENLLFLGVPILKHITGGGGGGGGGGGREREGGSRDIIRRMGTQQQLQTFLSG